MAPKKSQPSVPEQGPPDDAPSRYLELINISTTRNRLFFFGHLGISIFPRLLIDIHGKICDFNYNSNLFPIIVR